MSLVVYSFEPIVKNCSLTSQEINRIMNACRYKIMGIYFPEAKGMVFDLTSVEELPAVRTLKNTQKQFL